MRKKSVIEEEILDKYLEKHSILSEQRLKSIKENISKMDLRLYEKLGEYDAKTGITNKQNQYIEIMTKPYRKKFGEKTKDYNKRVSAKRISLLKNHGIETRKTFSFKGLGKISKKTPTNIKNKEKAISEATKLKKLALKNPKEFASNIIDKLKISKSEIEIKAPKGLFKKMKERKDKNPKFKKRILRSVLAVGIATALSFSFTNTVIHDDSTATNFTPTKVIELYESPSPEVPNTSSKISVEVPKESKVKNQDATEITTGLSKFYSNTISSSKEATRKLIQNLNVDFSSTFKMENGNYWETPEETGRHGDYSDYNSSSLKITYVDVITDTGTAQYNIDSGMSISKIISQNPDAKFSYHVETTDGKILGWNSEDSNNIEKQLIIGKIESLKSHISSENMQYLNSIDIEKLSDKDMQKISNIVKESEINNLQETNKNDSDLSINER